MNLPAEPCATIDEVIARMDAIVQQCADERSKLGYFAALYRNVTIRVRDGIAAGRFEDGPRMARLDVIFANRYLDALGGFLRGERPTECWDETFKTATWWSPMILQHLLMGMNAHIDLDLSIAAAQTSPGAAFPALKRDFDEITVILDEMIQSIQDRIDAVSPWMRILDWVGGRTDEKVMSFAITEARDLAWLTAERLAVATPEEFATLVAAHDVAVAALDRVIRSPRGLVWLAVNAIRLRESRNVPHVIATLSL